MAKTRCVATRIEFFRDFFLNSLLSDYSSYFITFSLVLLLLFKVFLVFLLSASRYVVVYC